MKRTADHQHDVERTASGMRPTATVAKASPHASTRKSVLLVDDNDSFRALLTGYLEQLGWEVVSASSAAQALARFRAAAETSIALIDVRLPDRDGDALARELRSLSRGLQIVFVTGDGSFEGSSPVAPIIRKPIDLSELVSVLERLLSPALRARDSA